MATADASRAFRNASLLGMSEDEYSDAVSRLLPVYRALDLTVSGATIVVNSKARQYTIRFFTQPPDKRRGP